MNERLSDCY